MRIFIGFVPQENLDIKLPVGFDDKGHLLTPTCEGWPQNCHLVLLDDRDYGKSPLKGDGLAMVFQHISNRDNWKQQLEALRLWGYRPWQIDEYSRIDTFSFWQDITKLLAVTDSDSVKASILDQMADRYDLGETLHSLECLCVGKVLGDGVWNSIELRRQRRSLHGGIKQNLEDFLGKDITPSEFIDSVEEAFNNVLTENDVSAMRIKPTKYSLLTHEGRAFYKNRVLAIAERHPLDIVISFCHMTEAGEYGVWAGLKESIERILLEVLKGGESAPTLMFGPHSPVLLQELGIGPYLRKLQISYLRYDMPDQVLSEVLERDIRGLEPKGTEATLQSSVQVPNSLSEILGENPLKAICLNRTKALKHDCENRKNSWSAGKNLVRNSMWDAESFLSSVDLGQIEDLKIKFSFLRYGYSQLGLVIADNIETQLNLLHSSMSVLLQSTEMVDFISNIDRCLDLLSDTIHILKTAEMELGQCQKKSLWLMMM